MDDAIIISNLNDFIFCPASIYFHNLYGSRSTIMYQNSSQLKVEMICSFMCKVIIAHL